MYPGCGNTYRHCTCYSYIERLAVAWSNWKVRTRLIDCYDASEIDDIPF